MQTTYDRYYFPIFGILSWVQISLHKSSCILVWRGSVVFMPNLLFIIMEWFAPSWCNTQNRKNSNILGMRAFSLCKCQFSLLYNPFAFCEGFIIFFIALHHQ